MGDDIYFTIGTIVAAIFAVIMIIEMSKDGGVTADRALVFPIPILLCCLIWPFFLAVGLIAFGVWVYGLSRGKEPEDA